MLVVANEDVAAALMERLPALVAAEHEGRFTVEPVRVPLPRSDIFSVEVEAGSVPPPGDWDIVVLTVQADAEHVAWRDEGTGDLRAAAGADIPPEADLLGLIAPADSRRHLGDLIRGLRAETGAHMLLCNASSVVPGDEVHCYQGLSTTLAERVGALNLEAIRLSSEEGVAIIDVDRILAEAGAGANVVAPLRYSAAAQTAIAAETQRVISELGFFEERPLVPQVGSEGV